MVTTTWDQKAGMSSPTDADNLESYVDQAAASEAAAAAAAAAAAVSEVAAAASEEAAIVAKNSAATSATTATTGAATATTKASEAAASATSASTSASAAQTAQTAAEASAAAASASEAGVDADRVAAEAAASAASTSETNAATSASSAATSASEAAASAASINPDSIDINGGTIDGTVIGGTTPAAGSFTNITATGTVDGRDVASDGTKLDGIEAGADVTDTANVTAAGALMDSEVTNLAQVKAFDSSDYATAAQGALADTSVQPNDSPTFGSVTVTGTVDGRDIAADGTKLDGIEAGADVTDTANVTAAGALMDSEVTNLAQVKAFDSSDYATAAQGSLADSAVQPDDDVSLGEVTVDRLTVDGKVAAGDELGNANLSNTLDYTTNLGVAGYRPINLIDQSAGIKISRPNDDGNGSFIEFQEWDSTITTLYTRAFIVGEGGDLLYRNLTTGGGDHIFQGEANAELMRIDSSGNVGIGTSSPSSPLHVVGQITGSTDLVLTSGSSSEIRLEDSTATNGYILRANVSGVADFGFKIEKRDGTDLYDVGLAASPHVWYGNAGDERMRIDASGNLGIGTSSPDSLLTVDGQVIIGDLVANSPNLTNLTSGTPPQLIAGWSVPAISWTPNASTEAVFTRDGNTQVDILTGSGNLSNLNFSDPDDEDVGQISYNHSVDAMILRTNNAERMRIDSSGNVGIGTSSPDAKLDIFGASSDQIRLRTAESEHFAIGRNASTGYLDFYGSQTGYTGYTFGGVNGTRMTIDSSGNVGIGTSSPQEKLHVIGSAKLDFGSAGGNPRLYFDHDTVTDDANYIQLNRGDAGLEIISENNLKFDTNGSEAMRITSAGSVGIGTSSPSQLLHVNGGNAVISGTLAVGTTDLSTDLGYSSRVKISGTGPAVFLEETDTSQSYAIAAVGGSLVIRDATALTSRVTLTSTGNVLVSSTSADPALDGTAQAIALRSDGRISARGTDNFATMTLSRGGTDGSVVGFYKATTLVGTISVSASATAYNTSSDYRLKEDVQPMSDASGRVLALNPVNFAWKVDGTRVDGFLAHEAQAVVPEAVTGEKDGEEMQAIDQSKLVPLLTAALQEALTKIDALETRITALEG